LSFDPWNCSLKFQESTRTPSPKVGVALGVWRFIPSHFPTLSGICDVTPGLSLGLHPCNPFALVASPKLGLQQDTWKHTHENPKNGQEWQIRHYSRACVTIQRPYSTTLPTPFCLTLPYLIYSTLPLPHFVLPCFALPKLSEKKPTLQTLINYVWFRFQTPKAKNAWIWSRSFLPYHKIKWKWENKFASWLLVTYLNCTKYKLTKPVTIKNSIE